MNEKTDVEEILKFAADNRPEVNEIIKFASKNQERPEVQEILKFAAENTENAFVEGIDPQAAKNAPEGETVPDEGEMPPEELMAAMQAQQAQGSDLDRAIAQAIRTLSASAAKGSKDAGALLKDIIIAVKTAEMGPAQG